MSCGAVALSSSVEVAEVQIVYQALTQPTGQSQVDRVPPDATTDVYPQLARSVAAMLQCFLFSPFGFSMPY